MTEQEKQNVKARAEGTAAVFERVGSAVVGAEAGDAIMACVAVAAVVGTQNTWTLEQGRELFEKTWREYAALASAQAVPR